MYDISDWMFLSYTSLDTDNLELVGQLYHLQYVLPMSGSMAAPPAPPPSLASKNGESGKCMFIHFKVQPKSNTHNFYHIH